MTSEELNAIRTRIDDAVDVNKEMFGIDNWNAGKVRDIANVPLRDAIALLDVLEASQALAVKMAKSITEIPIQNGSWCHFCNADLYNKYYASPLNHKPDCIVAEALTLLAVQEQTTESETPIETS